MRYRYAKKEYWILLAGAVMIVLMMVLNITIFRKYQENLLALQEDHMLTTVKAVANSLENYYDETLDHFAMYFDQDVTEEKLQEYCGEVAEVSSAYLFTEQGEVLYGAGERWDGDIPALLQDYRQRNTARACLLPPVLAPGHRYRQCMVKEVGGKDGARVYAAAFIDTDAIYQKIVKPIRIGKNGYSMVKDFDGTILMHKSAEQVGLDAVAGRRERYSEYDLDLDDLERWVREQRENTEGSRILDSYWWEDGKDPVKTQKVVAYTQVPIGEERWIVNGTLDYGEIQEPLKTTQWYVFLLTAGVVLIFGLLLLVVVGNASRNRAVELEMKHLLEMNEAWEELHKREEQIRHNDKMKTLGAMTSMISHEFNNFLTPIMLYGEMLMGDPGISGENKACLREIVEAAGKSRDLTRELSRYGRMEREAGKKVPVQVSGEIRRSLKLFSKTLPANVALRQELEADDGLCLYAGAGMVNQIMMNLCTNAIHAMREKGGILTVKGRLIREGEAVHYGITVQDTGKGIPEEEISRIFTPFYTTKEIGAGTGLGLSVVQDLIHQVSGDISVVSAEGEGTRFDILLPLSDKPEDKKDVAGRETLEGRRIYVLDDNEKVGKALEKGLKAVCAKVRTSAKPERALAEIRSDIHGWDIVIADYSMPMMNGVEFAGILRSLGYSGTFILISGCLDRDIRWYLDNGIVDQVLEKPVRVEEIEAAARS